MILSYQKFNNNSLDNLDNLKTKQIAAVESLQYENLQLNYEITQEVLGIVKILKILS